MGSNDRARSEGAMASEHEHRIPLPLFTSCKAISWATSGAGRASHVLGVAYCMERAALSPPSLMSQEAPRLPSQASPCDAMRKTDVHRALRIS